MAGPVSEWMVHVLGEGTEFENNDAAKAMESAVIRHCKGVILTLAHEPALCGPVLEVDERTDEVVWKSWIGGFARAMRLRPGAWARIEASEELDVLEAVQVIRTLFSAANGTCRLSEEGPGHAGPHGSGADRRPGAGPERTERVYTGAEPERG